MFEVTYETIEGINFIKDIRLKEADASYLGVPVHEVRGDIEPNFIAAIRQMGFRKVGYSFERDIDYYAASKWYALAKSNKMAVTIYWVLIRFLYDWCRVFKRIPPGEMFSWRYFTLYVAWKNALRWMRLRR